ncbi:MAG TPA: calcium-binding protein [Thermoanaerobaculia bacterium]|nr:calcium-binding protein [Thermoanaerobaculia bacterium]
MSRTLPRILITIGIVALSPTLLHAAVVVTDLTTFVVGIDANDAVSVDCSAGFVRVTDDGAPTTYTTACASVLLLRVTASGVFDNTIDLSGVTAAGFPQLAAGGAQPVDLSGGGGVDTLTGSGLGDIVRGGPGNDSMFGGTGDDVFTWVPGDGSDTIQGGAGSDVLAFVGAAAAEAFAVTADGAGFDFTRDVGSIVMDLEGIETLELSTLGGNNSVTLNDLTGVADLTSVILSLGDTDDVVDASAQANPAVSLTVFANMGNDTLIGGAGADELHGDEGNDSISGLGGVDTIDGGDGDDSINGGPGNETLVGGAGDDTFVWNPGDGSDTLVGGTGRDTMFFNGAAGNEAFALTGQGAGFRFTRDVGGIVMDATEVEEVRLNTLGGNDSATVGDLTGVANLNTITFFMGDGDDTANASAEANPAIAFLVNGGTGNDTLTGSPNSDTIAGGEGNDTIVGLSGVDLMDGGAGDDTITGGPGNEPNQNGGDGDDTFIWNPGDGSDGLVGQTGNDTMVFNGSAGNELFVVTAQGADFRLTRDVGSIVMDATGVEAITLNALGGDDHVTTVGLAATSQNLIGGTQTTADALTVDAQGACATSGTGTVAIAGAQPITFSEFESVDVLNPCAAPAAVGVPTLSPLAMVALAAFLAIAALFVIRSR